MRAKRATWTSSKISATIKTKWKNCTKNSASSPIDSKWVIVKQQKKTKKFKDFEIYIPFQLEAVALFIRSNSLRTKKKYSYKNKVLRKEILTLNTKKKKIE